MSNILKYLAAGLVVGYIGIAGWVYYVSDLKKPSTPSTEIAQVEPAGPPESGKNPEHFEDEPEGAPESGITKKAEVEEEPTVELAPIVRQPPEQVEESTPKKIINWVKKKVSRSKEPEEEPVLAKKSEPKPTRKVVEESKKPIVKSKTVEVEPRKKLVDFSSRDPGNWSTGKCTSNNDVKNLPECQWHRNLLPHRMNPATEGR